MHQRTVKRLLDLNRTFYDGLAVPFSKSREKPQPGFYRLLEELPRPCARFLDLGCGDGRLGRFLFSHEAITHYTGIDFSRRLLAIAAASLSGNFHQRELSETGCLDGLGQFDAAACLAVLQHIPGRTNRVKLLSEIGEHLAVNGRLFLSTWQFVDSSRLARKVQPWQAIDMSASDVEPNDYLLTWQREGFSYRYVALIDAPETERLAKKAGLRVVKQFRSDGKEGDLNLYSVLRPS